MLLTLLISPTELWCLEAQGTDRLPSARLIREKRRTSSMCHLWHTHHGLLWRRWDSLLTLTQFSFCYNSDKWFILKSQSLLNTQRQRMRLFSLMSSVTLVLMNLTLFNKLLLLEQLDWITLTTSVNSLPLPTARPSEGMWWEGHKHLPFPNARGRLGLKSDTYSNRRHFLFNRCLYPYFYFYFPSGPHNLNPEK